MRFAPRLLLLPVLLVACSDAASVLTRGGDAANVVDTQPPTISLGAPVGGETFTSGTVMTVQWTSADNDAVARHDLSLSQDGGLTFPITIVTGLAGNATSFAWVIPAAIHTSMARVRIVSADAAGNTGTAQSGNFTIVRLPVADLQPPAVSIAAPAAGATLIAGQAVAVQFTSTDNVGVASHDVVFASDGINFNTTLASGLAGNATTFTFRVPTIGVTNAAIRVNAKDAAGNVGSATVGSLRILVDVTAPTVVVTFPGAKDKPDGGSLLTVQWNSSDDTGIASHELAWSDDGGATFTALATGIPGNVQSWTFIVPAGKDKDAVVRVTARDVAGNATHGVSPAFKVKAARS